MKHLRMFLLLLAVCLTQASFSQDLAKKWEEGGKLKSAIAQVLADANTEQEAESSISRLIKGDGDYITEQDKQNIANGYLEKCKKNLAKWDAKLAEGKKVSSNDAMYAANYYILGYKKICEQNYSKALEYIKLCPQIPITKMYTVALQYQLTKDKDAAKAAMNFIDKPSAQLSNVASQFGLADVYQEKLMSLIADKKQTIKRAVRSKDFATLLAYIPYDMPEVDSLFATNNVPIAIARIQTGNYFRDRSLEDVEDFEDRNVIKIYQGGDDPTKWSVEYYGDYFINKCVYKHEMPWTLTVDFDINKIAESYPVKLQILAFAMTGHGADVSDPDYYEIENYLNNWCGNCDKDNSISEDNIRSAEQHMLNYIKSFQPRNILASYLAAVMVQVYGQIGKKTTGFHNRITYTTEFKMELFNATKEIVDQVPWLKDQKALPVTISDNGKVMIKEGRDNPDEIAKNIYEPIMNFIWAAYNKYNNN